jgi:hypothetical protein
VSCGGRAGNGPAVDGRETVQELRARLESMAGREDPDANLERARIHAQLRKLGEASALARGDEADVKVLAGPARGEQKAESVRRLADHFLERAERPALCRSSFGGPLGDLLRRYSMVLLASRFSEYAGKDGHAGAIERLAALAAEFGDLEALKADARERWQKRSRTYLLRASDLRTKPAPPVPSPETLKFCEYSVSRHLEESTRAMDFGTREKAARGEPDRILEWYLLALEHLVVARECLDEPSEVERQALAALEVVARHLTLELVREP